MSQTYGIARPAAHRHDSLQPPARWLVLLPNGESEVALLFTEARAQVAEFDAATLEVAQMTAGVPAQAGAAGADWDRALAHYSPAQRAQARVYPLGV